MEYLSKKSVILYPPKKDTSKMISIANKSSSKSISKIQSKTHVKTTSFHTNENITKPTETDHKRLKTQANIENLNKENTLRTELENLKYRLVSSIKTQEKNTVMLIKSFTNALQLKLDDLSKSLLDDVTSFSRILIMNIRNSFVELESELIEIEKQKSNFKKLSYENHQNLDFKIHDLQRKLTNFSFDSSVFPMYELDQSYADKLASFIKVHHVPKCLDVNGKEKNLFLESVNNPFIDQNIQKNQIVAPETRPNRTPRHSKGAPDQKLNIYKSVPKTESSLEKDKISHQVAYYQLSNLAKLGSLKFNPLRKPKNQISIAEIAEKPVSGNINRSKSNDIFLNNFDNQNGIKNIRVFNFSNLKVGENELIKEISKIDNKNEPFYLNLSFNLLNDLALKTVLRSLVDYNVVFLNLESNLLTDDSLGFLISFKNYNNFLSVLYIRNNTKIKENDVKVVERKKSLEEKGVKIYC